MTEAMSVCLVCLLSIEGQRIEGGELSLEGIDEEEIDMVMALK